MAENIKIDEQINDRIDMAENVVGLLVTAVLVAWYYLVVPFTGAQLTAFVITLFVVILPGILIGTFLGKQWWAPFADFIKTVNSGRPADINTARRLKADVSAYIFKREINFLLVFVVSGAVLAYVLVVFFDLHAWYGFSIFIGAAMGGLIFPVLLTFRHILTLQPIIKAVAMIEGDEEEEFIAFPIYKMLAVTLLSLVVFMVIFLGAGLYNRMLIDQGGAVKLLPALAGLIIVSGALLILSGVLVVMLASKYLTDPLKEIEKEMRLLAKGELIRTISYASGDELGMLAGSCRNMIKKMVMLKEQAEVIAEDRLKDQCLKTEMEGDLGKAFSKMVKTLQELADAAGKVAEGDFRVRIGRNGALANSFNRMVDNLAKLSLKAGTTGVQLSSVSMQLQNAAEEQASGAEEQSGAVAEVTVTIEELMSSAGSIAKNAEAVIAAAVAALEKMKGINVHVGNTTKKILTLGENSQEIGSITNLIGEMAEKSNLLALNASIEAARAGSAGKGFGVVAAEVGKLADRSAESTEKIRKLVNEIQEEISSAIVGVEESNRIVDEGLQMVGGTTRLAKEIGLATQQQKTAVEQVVQGMKNIDQVSREFVGSTRRMVDGADRLNVLAEELKQTMNRFRTRTGVPGAE